MAGNELDSPRLQPKALRADMPMAEFMRRCLNHTRTGTQKGLEEAAVKVTQLALKLEKQGTTKETVQAVHNLSKELMVLSVKHGQLVNKKPT